MYEFHYDVMKKNYGSNAQLLFTDTDSLCYHEFPDDHYVDMMSLRDEWLGTSEYPTDHKLYSPPMRKF